MSKQRQLAFKTFAAMALGAGATVTAGNKDAAKALESAREEANKKPINAKIRHRPKAMPD